MKASKTKQREINGINNAPKSHVQLSKEDKRKAKRLKKRMPQTKYKMKVYYADGREFCELEAETKSKLEKSHITLGRNYPNVIFTYGEIKPIKVK